MTIPFLGWGQTGDSCYSDISMVLQEVEVSIVSDAVCEAASSTSAQGGRTWQPFVGGKNGHENFRQARTYNFCDKCVVFARNLKFANLIQ